MRLMVFFPMPVVKEISEGYSSCCSELSKQKSFVETRKVTLENPIFLVVLIKHLSAIVHCYRKILNLKLSS